MICKLLAFYKKKWDYRMRRRFGKNVDIAQGVLVSKNTVLEGYNFIAEDVNIIDSQIGMLSYIGHSSYLYECKIGKFCSISWNVEVLAGEHPLNTISTHPIFYSERKFGGVTFEGNTDFKELKYTPNGFLIEIGNDVLINAHAKIVSGVTVGHGAVIRAGAIVTKDVPPYAIIAGVPAVIIGYRFSSEDIAFLLEYKWWDKDILWIKKHVHYFDNISKLRSLHEN